MQNAIVEQETLATPVAPDESGGYMAIIEKLAANPTTQSVDVIERMMKMQTEWEARQAKKAFDAAMTRVAARLINIRIIKRRGVAYKGEEAFKYAALEDIDKLVAPVLVEEGFSVSYDTAPSAQQGWHDIIVRVSNSGHTESSRIPLPLDSSGGKNNTQGMGSTYTYGKRYALCAFFNIVTVGEDDDGAGGVIDEAQAANIKQLIKDSGADTRKFLDKICGGAASVEEIPFKLYRKATVALEEKKKGKANGHNS